MDILFNISGFGEFPFRTYVELNGISICMHFLNEKARNVFSRPFSHLETEEKENSGFDIYVIHGGPAEEPIEGWRRFEREASEERKLLTYGKDGTYVLYNYESKVLAGYDSKRKKACYYIPSLDMLPLYEMAAPMKIVFHHFAQDHGMILVHGAAIAMDGIGVLIAGRGGSGKTTTAICAALGGFDYLGDDYVILDPENKAIHSLYSSSKIRWDSEKLLPELGSLAVNGRNEDKGYFFMNEINDRVRKSVRLRAVVIPKLGGEDPSYARISGITALRVLSSSTIFQMPGSGQRILGEISRVLRDIPVYEMILGRDVFRNNRKFEELIKGL